MQKSGLIASAEKQPSSLAVAALERRHLLAVMEDSDTYSRATAIIAQSDSLELSSLSGYLCAMLHPTPNIPDMCTCYSGWGRHFDCHQAVIKNHSKRLHRNLASIKTAGILGIFGIRGLDNNVDIVMTKQDNEKDASSL